MEQRVLLRGTLGSDDGQGLVRIDAEVACPPDAVWAALTDPARLADWYGHVEGDLRVGGAYRAVLFPSGWDGFGTVLACERARRLVVESAEPGRSSSTDEIELAAADDGTTRLVLTKRGVPLEMLPAYGVGTQLHVENLLAHLAGGGPVDPDLYWTELLPRYERLAASI